MGKSNSRIAPIQNRCIIPDQVIVSKAGTLQKKIFKYYSRYSKFKKQDYSWPMIFFKARHSEMVASCSYSYDRKFLAIGLSKKIKIWNIKEQKKEFSLNGHLYKVKSCSYSPDGNYLAAASNACKCCVGDIKIWNIKEKREEFSLDVDLRQIEFCSYSPNGNYLMLASISEIKIWNIKEHREEATLSGDIRALKCCSYSPDGNYLATGIMNSDENHEINIWNIKQEKVEFIFKGFSDWINCCSYSPDGNYLAAGSNELIIWNIPKQREEFILNRFPYRINCCCYSGDGTYLLAGLFDYRNAISEVKVWDLKIQRTVFNINIKSEEIAFCSYSPDENFVVTVSNDYMNIRGEINLWNIKEQRDEFFLNESIIEISCCSSSPDGKYLATALYDKHINIGQIKVWNIKNKREEFSLNGHSREIDCCSFSPDGNYLATSSLNEVKIWNLNQQKENFTINDFSENKKYISYSPDGNFLAFASKENIKIWNIKEQRDEFSINELSNIKIINTRDGNILVSGSIDHNIEKWMKNLKLYNNSNTCISISTNDGLFIISENKNGSITIRNNESRRKEFILNYYNSKLLHLSFTKNEQYLILANRHKVICIGFWNKLLYILNDNLSRCNSERKDIKDLYKDAKVAYFIYNHYHEYNQSKVEIESQLPKYLNKMLNEYYKTKNSLLLLKMSKFLVKFANLSFNLQFLMIDTIKIINNYYSMKIKNLQDIEGKYDILALRFFIDLIVEIEVKQRIEASLQKLLQIRENQIRNEKQINHWSLIEIDKFIKIEEISENRLYKTEYCKYFNINYYNSVYSGRNVIIKEYEFHFNIPKELKTKIRSEFDKEVNCYELLNHYKNNLNSSLKYFGFIKSVNSYSLVFKHRGSSLIRFLSKIEKLKSEEEFNISNVQMALIVKSLVNSFAFLTRHNILHRYITPFSLLIDENFNIEICDFFHAAIKWDDVWYEPSELLIPKLLNDYKSPEEKTKGKIIDIDLEKSDVFSLGLVILQFVHLKSIQYIKKNLDLLLNDLEGFNLKWLQKVLLNMLSVRPQDRLTFSQLAKLIDDD